MCAPSSTTLCPITFFLSFSSSIYQYLQIKDIYFLLQICHSSFLPSPWNFHTSMGNVFSVSIFIEDIDCIAARANYLCKLDENRVTLRIGLQKLRELKNDVNRKVDVAERQQMKRLDQVQGWISRVEDMETEVGQLIGDGVETLEKKRLCGCCYPKHCISSYTLGKKWPRSYKMWLL